VRIGETAIGGGTSEGVSSPYPFQPAPHTNRARTDLCSIDPLNQSGLVPFLTNAVVHSPMFGHAWIGQILVVAYRHDRIESISVRLIASGRIASGYVI
jgi:hypothetical protein